MEVKCNLNSTFINRVYKVQKKKSEKGNFY